jgi:glycine dehydrogenase subunit 1
VDYVPNTEADLQAMLRDIGVADFEELLTAIPKNLRVNSLNLPPALTECELVRELGALAQKNLSLDSCISFLGAGAYEHFIPAAVDALASRGEFMTAYTPYQAEASQGTLQAIYEFQSLICRLTALEVANASLYDGASALAEAAIVCLQTNSERRTMLVSSAIHPDSLAVLRTYTSGALVNIVEIPAKNGVTDADALKNLLKTHTDIGGVFVQSPNFFGCIEPMPKFSALARSANALFVASVNPISLGILAPPGEYDADIAVGEAQPLGIPISYGGPWCGFIAAKKKLAHKLPGRIVGRTVDTDGNSGFVLTLQAREQHIRRERASSNICTNQSLMALRAAIYMSLLGKEGLRELAELNLRRAHDCAEKISKISGFKLKLDAPFFNEFVVSCPISAQKICDELLESHGILAGFPMGNDLLVCVTETKLPSDIEKFASALKKFAKK